MFAGTVSVWWPGPGTPDGPSFDVAGSWWVSERWSAARSQSSTPQSQCRNNILWENTHRTWDACLISRFDIWSNGGRRSPIYRDVIHPRSGLLAKHHRLGKNPDVVSIQRQSLCMPSLCKYSRNITCVSQASPRGSPPRRAHHNLTIPQVALPVQPPHLAHPLR